MTDHVPVNLFPLEMRDLLFRFLDPVFPEEAMPGRYSFLDPAYINLFCNRDDIDMFTPPTAPFEGAFDPLVNLIEIVPYRRQGTSVLSSESICENF
jgi:hypothetical protein